MADPVNKKTKKIQWDDWRRKISERMRDREKKKKQRKENVTKEIKNQT